MTEYHEERAKAARDQMNARMAEQEARVHEWIERTRGKALSKRARFDGWADVMRPSNIEMLEGAERLGWIRPRADRAHNIQAAMCEFGLYREPNSGWSNFCYELDLIFIALPDQVDERNIGHSGMSKLIEREAEVIAAAKSRLQDLSCNMDYLWAESSCGGNYILYLAGR